MLSDGEQNVYVFNLFDMHQATGKKTTFQCHAIQSLAASIVVVF